MSKHTGIDDNIEISLFTEIHGWSVYGAPSMHKDWMDQHHKLALKFKFNGQEHYTVIDVDDLPIDKRPKPP